MSRYRPTKRKCAACGNEFTATRRDAMTCSDRCRKWLSRAPERKQHALDELTFMARRADEIAKTYAGSQEVCDQMSALKASITARWEQATLKL